MNSEETMLNAAIEYSKQDGHRPPLKIIPVKPNGKRPYFKNWTQRGMNDPEEIRKHWTAHPNDKIGILTGAVNGIIVIDIDQKPDQGKTGEESLQKLIKKLGELPETWEVITGSGGRHLYFKYPEGYQIKNSSSKVDEWIDIKTDGGQVIAPPSIHPETGRRYEWEAMHDPSETPLAELPEPWLLKLEKASAEEKEASDGENGHYTEPDEVTEGHRNDGLFLYAAHLRGSCTEALKMLKMMNDFNDNKCKPPLSSSEVEKIYNSVMRYPGGAGVEMIINDIESLKEESDLSRFHFMNKDKPSGVFDYRIFEYLKEKQPMFVMGGTPFLYKDGVYRPDQNGAQLKTAIRKLIYPELIRSNTIDRIYRLFLSAEELQINDTSQINKYPDFAINFKNGFYSPKSGRMIEHDPQSLAINQIPHSYDPDAQLDGEEIEKWLNFIVPDPVDREMLLQYCGLCMTRDTKQQKFLILTGEGGSGKSTLIRMIETVVGSENISSISLKDITQRFASFGLMGKLMNSCADLEPGVLEDTAIIKKILGEDRIRGEQKNKDPIFFKSYAKLIFSANELPTIMNEKTTGFFRRLLIITMDKQPPQKRADYIQTLQGEVDYFIQLCVRALERMYQNGLICESEHSKKSVEQLREDSDSVQAWISEEMIRDKDGRLERTYLYGRYETYCFKLERKKLSKHNFYKSLKLKGFREMKSGGSRYFEGLKVLP